MATDVNVIIPSDVGTTIKLGAKVLNKYDVDVSALDIPEQITAMTLVDTTLTLTSSYGNKSVDLEPILPVIAADVFLKDVTRTGNDLVFTVGHSDDTTADTVFTIDVSDLLPVQTDGSTITGNGTTASKLSVQVSTATTDNMVVKVADGLAVSKADIVTVINDTVPTDVRDVRLVNATGTTTVAYAYSTEQ